MSKIPNDCIYSTDIVKIKSSETTFKSTKESDFIEETVYRLRYKWYGETYTMLFDYDSDLREYVDEHYQSWMRNFHRNQPPNPQADSKV